MLGKLFRNSNILEKALDGSWIRNEAISQNIANVDTPGYKKKTVSFEEALSDAIEKNTFKGLRTHEKHIVIGSGNINDIEIKTIEDNSPLAMRLDGNNVDIDNEMASMAKNTIQYNTLTQRVNSEFKKLKSVISEGRR